jgi:heme/copper-type cytochrome/quinol oxidase subunit 2
MLGEISGGWGWWLPPNHSEHGVAIDIMFNWIFWITTIVMIAVEVVLVYFLIKYRDRGDARRAKFIHGNSRLELAWTLIPAAIFAAIALASKGVWDKYRYAEPQANRAEILVIAQQFAWNVVYPGPDNKLGDYLVFPKPTDPLYRKYSFDEAVKKINEYIADAGDNPLGVDMSGPNAQYALENDYVITHKDGSHTFHKQSGRAVVVPAGRQIRIWLSSKDVIHDFYLPNFRVKLDAVPGMRGHIDMVAQLDSQSTQTVSLDNAELVAASKTDRPMVAWLSPSSTHIPLKYDADYREYYLPDPADPTKQLVRCGQGLDEQTIGMLSEAGIKEINAVTKPYEVVCEELCGMGHTTMRAPFFVLSQAEYEEYNDRIDKNEPHPATRPTGVASAR